MNFLYRTSLILALAALSACATETLHSSARPALSAKARWAVAPFANYTTTPGAGRRAASMATSLLLAHGFKNTVAITARTQSGLPLESIPNPKRLLVKAQDHGARYLLQGAVQEWRYTIGLDGQPAVAVTLNVVSVRTGRTLWTATGSRSGSPRESVGVLAERTLNAMVTRLVP